MDFSPVLTREVFEHIGEPILVFDFASRRAILANRTAVARSGHPDPVAAGMTCSRIFHRRNDCCEIPPADCPLHSAVSEGKTVRRIHTSIDPEGKISSIDVLATPIPDRNGGCHVIFSVRDAPETTNSARGPGKSYDLKTLSTDIVGHDLINLAAVIRYCADSLQDSEVDGRRIHLWQMMERSLSWLVRIIDSVSLLTLVEKTGEIELRDIDLGELVRDVIGSLERRWREKGQRVEFVTPGIFPAAVNPILGDAFLNVLDNAVTHSPRGGTISVSIFQVCGGWVVSFRDSGPGIAGNARERIFERFTRFDTGNCGLGLGLSIAKRIAVLHGGDIWVEDAPDGGSDFLLSVRRSGGRPHRG